MPACPRHPYPPTVASRGEVRTAAAPRGRGAALRLATGSPVGLGRPPAAGAVQQMAVQHDGRILKYRPQPVELLRGKAGHEQLVVELPDVGDEQAATGAASAPTAPPH